MKKIILLVSTILSFTTAQAQPKGIHSERKQMFLSIRVIEETWIKSIFRSEYIYQVFPTNDGRKVIWDEAHRILQEYGLQFDKPDFDYSNVFEGLELNDSLMVLEAMDRAGMDLSLTYLLPNYFLYVVMGEELNVIYLKKMTRKQKANLKNLQEESKNRPAA